MEFEEVGSGAKTRPKREELMRMARRRDIDVVLVWKLDRFGRSLLDLITSLNELTGLGVGFVSLTESLNFSTPSGRAMAGMLFKNHRLNTPLPELPIVSQTSTSAVGPPGASRISAGRERS